MKPGRHGGGIRIPGEQWSCPGGGTLLSRAADRDRCRKSSSDGSAR